MKPNYCVLLILSTVLFFHTSGCERDEMLAIRSIETIEPYISGETVVSGGIVRANRDIDLIRYGICYSTENNPTVDDTVIAGEDLNVSREMGTYLYEFKCVMILSPDIEYFIRTFIETRTGFAYGKYHAIHLYSSI